MLSKLPIKLSATLLVALPVLIVGIWLSLMWSNDSRNSIEKLASQSLSEIHAMVTTRVESTLSMPPRVTKLNAHLIHTGVLDPADLQSWRDTLINQSQQFDMLSAISWGSADGRTTWISRYADGNDYWALLTDPQTSQMQEWQLKDGSLITSEPTSTYDFNLFTRPWFTTPRDAAEPTWSQPYQWVGGEEITFGLSFGIPIYKDHDNDSEFLGVIDADFSLNDLSDFLKTISVGESGTVALIDETHTLLASSSEAPIITNNAQRLPLGQSQDPLLVAADAWQSGQNAQRLDHSMVRINNANYFLHQSRVGESVGLQWKLISIVPESDFLGDIDAGFQRSTILSLLAVVIAAIIGFQAARWIVSPILTLVAAVRQIGEGDLDTEVNLNHAPEYTQLASEINAMTTGLKDRMRMRESLALAQEVQESLLPSSPPTIPGLDIAGHSTYCDETGGDYYDFIDISSENQHEVIIALGDVMGHGVAAAMLMATARGILRSRCEIPGSISDFLKHLNELLVPDTQGQRFMTMLLVTIDVEHRTLRWASAGHGAPILYNINTDEFLEHDGGGVPLGLVANQSFEEYTHTNITPGHIIIAATDGLWEAKDPQGNLFGMDRVHELIRKHANDSAEQISNAFREALTNFSGPEGQDDDLTFVITKTI